MPWPAVLIWVVLAWPLPALVAGAAGWHGVWGSGSALVDYLIPVPVAGGVLHVPSFLLGAVAVAQASRWSALALSRARVLALCAALAGAWFLFDLPAGRVHENPLALFVCSDGAMALVLLSVFGGQLGFRREPLSVAVGLALGSVLGLAALMALLGPGAPAFDAGLGSADSTGTYQRQFVHTTLGPDGEQFRARAVEWAEQHHHPWLSKEAEVVSLHFTAKSASALVGDTGGVFVTLCLYEDGTSPRWLPPVGNCSADHLSFDERARRAARRLPDTVPPDEARERGLRQACAEAPPAPAAPASAWVSRVWRCEAVSPSSRGPTR